VTDRRLAVLFGTALWTALAAAYAVASPAAFVRQHSTTVIVWAVGLGVLYLRLVSKSLEVSGHLTWLPLLTVQAWLLGLPMWIGLLGLAALGSAAYLKFAVFQGPSGGPGLVVGLVLSTVLALAARERR
jgi:hypothetical protein